MYNPITTRPAPDQRKFNGDYGFPFIATAAEFDAGSVIVRGTLVGVSHRNTPEGEHGTAEFCTGTLLQCCPACETNHRERRKHRFHTKTGYIALSKS